MIDSLNFAGEVIIDEVTIINSRGFAQTITPQVIGIELFEDIFSPTLSGNITIRDSMDLVGLFPIIGEEHLKIVFHTPSLPKEHWYYGDFYIYKMEDRFNATQRELIYTLNFVSKEAIVDLNKKISKVYSGNVGDIVRSIIKAPDGLESKKTINIEDVRANTKYISNYWSPIRNIQYLTENAVNANNNPSYVYFENKYGLNFVSLESLYANPVKQEFRYDNYVVDVNSTGGTRKDPNKDFMRILEMSTPTSFDYMTRIQSGVYGSRMFHYDPTTKKYSVLDYTYDTDFTKDKHLNPNSLTSRKHLFRPAAVHVHESKYHANFTGYGDVTNTKSLQHRIALLGQAEGNKLQIVVHGRTDYSIGQVVEVVVYKSEQFQERDQAKDFKDNILSGKYIIAALNHKITKKSHECIMELIKDSLIVDINKGS